MLWSQTVKANSSDTEAFRFGLMSGPLVWGHVASYFTRLAQAVFHSAQEGRIPTYVDDPLMSLAGTR